MGYRLTEVKDDAEFPALMHVFRESFQNPYCPLWNVFVGDWELENRAKRDACLEEATGRFLAWHRHDPTSTWLKVVDEDTGEIAAGGRWSIYEKGAGAGGNPYDGHGVVEPVWFAEGEPRIVAGKLLADFLATAAKNMNRPHTFLNIMFTAPSHRRRGAASLIMGWGIRKANEKDLDLYLEASVEGKPLYEKHGFEAIEKHQFQIEVDDPELPPAKDSELRKAVIKALTPFTWWSMTKPQRPV